MPNKIISIDLVGILFVIRSVRKKYLVFYVKNITECSAGSGSCVQKLSELESVLSNSFVETHIKAFSKILVDIEHL